MSNEIKMKQLNNGKWFPFTVMDAWLFTGETDMVGVEIYEGDICQVWADWNAPKSMGDKRVNRAASRNGFGSDMEPVVVGHISQNPELLETL